MEKLFFFAPNFSCNCRSTKIASTVDLPSWNPNCFSSVFTLTPNLLSWVFSYTFISCSRRLTHGFTNLKKSFHSNCSYSLYKVACDPRRPWCLVSVFMFFSACSTICSVIPHIGPSTLSSSSSWYSFVSFSREEK